MVELHTCLWSDVAAFDFDEDDFTPLKERFPGLNLVLHRDTAGFLAAAGRVRYLLTWFFRRDWYESCPSLEAVYTPAAGHDWIDADPLGRVEVVRGTFHGPILEESLLEAILFMNRRMPAMIRNFQARGWNRNLQRECRLLRNQTVMIVGLGHIGAECARLLSGLCARVIGVKRDPGRLTRPLPGVEVRPVEELDSLLPEADHLVLLLPGGEGTDDLMNLARLHRCKKGVFLYNFGRGNALPSNDLAAAGDHIGGAFLDVTDREPLGQDSPLWKMDHVMITPHSSCVCHEYKGAFIREVMEHLGERLNGDVCQFGP